MINKSFLFTVLLISSLFNISNVFADQNDPRLDILFLNVKDSQNEVASSIYITSIWRIWSETNNQNSQQLYDLGNQLLKQRKYEQSLVIFTDLVNKEPNFAEGWNKRATLHFLMGNFNESIQDINKTLALEPRHFGALSGRAQIYIDQKEYQKALENLIQTKKIYPLSKGSNIIPKLEKILNIEEI